MANEKISAMPAATLPLAGTELVPLVQGGANVQAPASAVGVSTKVSIAATADAQIGTLPANAMIVAVLLHETAGHAVTVTLGTTSGGSDILGATAVGSSGIVPVNGPNLLLQAWTASQGIFIHSASWNSANVTVSVWYVQ